MPFLLTMPKLSPTMESGHITKWLKKEGEQIRPGDALFEVATDKATVEHSAIVEGWLRKILVPNGGEAKVNDPVAILTETKDESIEGFKDEWKERTDQRDLHYRKSTDCPESAPLDIDCHV